MILRIELFHALLSPDLDSGELVRLLIFKQQIFVFLGEFGRCVGLFNFALRLRLGNEVSRGTWLNELPELWGT